jgi:hypothetical protein
MVNVLAPGSLPQQKTPGAGGHPGVISPAKFSRDGSGELHRHEIVSPAKFYLRSQAYAILAIWEVRRLDAAFAH